VLIALGVALARRKQRRSGVRDAFERRPPGMPTLPSEGGH
jgi:hypothetical protein